MINTKSVSKVGNNSNGYKPSDVVDRENADEQTIETSPSISLTISESFASNVINTSESQINVQMEIDIPTMQSVTIFKNETIINAFQSQQTESNKSGFNAFRPSQAVTDEHEFNAFQP
ncbi:1868_t:CDS:2 [Ambispora leptoticha]|uniref:1868_t:CDS:1 n=1 Tax=Ambispora leptoticha TaxID=144679 RepID=A0A9N9AKY5_9GLOM|nr:1868_t:CDS:2 [Ambispora leptoticha]